jgi:hypothetical protein
MLLYFSMFLGAWFCVIFILKSGGAAIFRLNPDIINASEELVPAIAAFLVAMGSYSNYEFIKKADEAARQLCVRLASIPLLAEQLGYELAHQANFRVVSEGLKSRITETILNNVGPKALNFENDGSLSSQFTRAISLYWLFVQPHSDRTPVNFCVNSRSKWAYAKIMKLMEETVSRANASYRTLMQVGAAYFATAQPIRLFEEPVKKGAQETSKSVCSLIAQFVLLHEKTLAQRRNRLLSMGFDRYDQLPVFGVTRWAATLFVIALMTLVIVRVTPRSTPIEISEACLRVTVFAIQIGVSIAAGTFLAQRFLGRSEPTRGLLLIFELTLACLIIFSLSSVLKIGSSVVSAALSKTNTGEFSVIVSDFVNRWSTVLFAVANTISIGILCSYLTGLNWSRLGLAATGAICNGSVFVATALLVGFILPESVLSEMNVNLHTARLTMVLNSGVIGAAAGAMVLAMFRKTKPPAQVDASNKMPSPEGDGALRQWGTIPPKGEWADRELGGYSRSSGEEFEGTYVCFRPMFTKPDIINAYLVTIRWDAKQSCLTFREESRADGAYAQVGKIYIPNGKPFMNLVTADRGDMRLITVCRPDAQGVARGLVLTLSVPSGVNFTPASAPVVLRRLDTGARPRFGFVHPGEPDYALYQAQLLQVLPTYGVCVQAAATVSEEVS